MGDRAEKAKQLFREGYNCAQAVAGAFEDVIGIDHDMIMKVSSSFGGGLGRMREVCGAVSGMAMVLGATDGYSDPKDAQAKKMLYQEIQDAAKAFQEENGSIVCRELLGPQAGERSAIAQARTPEYYKKRPCVELVGCAAEILERRMEGQREDLDSGSNENA